MTTINGTTPFSLTVLNVQALVPLAYALPSFVLYLTIIVVILRKFEEPFYRLFAANGILVSRHVWRSEYRFVGMYRVDSLLFDRQRQLCAGISSSLRIYPFKRYRDARTVLLVVVSV